MSSGELILLYKRQPSANIRKGDFMLVVISFAYNTGNEDCVLGSTMIVEITLVSFLSLLYTSRTVFCSHQRSCQIVFHSNYCEFLLTL